MGELMVAIARRTGKATVAQLTKSIKNAAQAYYLGESVISDKEFDSMVEKLRKLAPESRILTIVGWGVKVHGAKVKLPATIQKSLEKYHDISSLKKALRSPKRVGISAKLDGLSALLKYDLLGRLKLACTRGDGTYGVDITIKMPFLNYGTALLRGPAGKVIRGELIIPIPVYNAHLKERYKNPRDAAAGIINSKSFENLDKIQFIAHDPYLGFDGEYARYIVGKISEESIGEFYKKIMDEKYYGIDGLVVYPKGDPSNKVAFKFPTEALEGTVRRVDWAISDTMQLCPTVELKERFTLYGKEIGGSITAHNAGYIKDNEIGPGAVVKVSRANEIIPEIVEVVSPRHVGTGSVVPEDWNGHPVYWEGPRLFVDNKQLEKIFRINRFLLTYFMPEGITDSDTLRKALKVESLQDIRDLVGRPIRIEKLLRKAKSGYGDGKIKKILPMFSKKRKLDPSVFFKAMGIRNLGNTVSEAAASHLSLFKDKHHQAFRQMCDRVVAHKHVALAIRDNWGYMQNSYMTFAGMMGVPEIKVEATKGSIVMTETGWTSREEIQDMCKKYGFSIQSSVNKRTALLVQKDPNSQTKKSKKARELGVRVISYNTLKRILEGEEAYG